MDAVVERFKETFDKCNNLKLGAADAWRWRTILGYRGRVPFVINLDNDDTFVTIKTDDDGWYADDQWVGKFDFFIGNSDGVVVLLESLCIHAEGV